MMNCEKIIFVKNISVIYFFDQIRNEDDCLLLIKYNENKIETWPYIRNEIKEDDFWPKPFGCWKIKSLK